MDVFFDWRWWLIGNLIAGLQKKILKTKIKIKSYGDEVTDFYDKEIPKVKFNSNHIFKIVISLDSALQKDENYY